MARTPRHTPEQIERLIAGYGQSGLTRRQYSAQQGIGVAMLDYYRLRQRKVPPAPLVRVNLNSSAPENHAPAKGFTLILTKNRRIEGDWNFSEQDLARLIRIVEAA